ncbi:6464_t:CDS:2 [Entrophospora sp. SA101]|nr:8991_t:CDS:2 [Entrophospora sp. SA101]CAJ0637971.1 7523_t:CDS:2 [Entrophospora sp. SA101]CAJ0766935.1 6464_t:CDS:2 [Entrophospora sp. SA101]CAJ0824966.1 21028_t:CDS:2 [Entrophospora sp. SA101]
MVSSRLFLMFAFTFMIALAKSVPVKDSPSFILPSVDSKEIISTIFNTNKRLIVPVKISYDDVNISTSVVVVNLKVENNKLIINDDVSLKLGKTSVQVIEAKVIPTDISKDEIDDYFDNYDIALITVEINSSVCSIPKKIDNLIINRVIISITIMEIDGVEVVQAKVIEKILEIKQIRKYISPSSDEFSNYYQIVKHHHHRSPCKNIIAM